MPRVYDKDCDYCGKHYHKAAKRFCSVECSARYSSVHHNSGMFNSNPRPDKVKPDTFKICPYCQHTFKVSKRNPKTMFCSNDCGYKNRTGRPNTEEHNKKIGQNNANYWLGKKNPSASQWAKDNLKYWQSGEGHWNWKGGITPTLKALRFTAEYRQWVQDVFKRDGYTCQECGIVGGRLQAHHHIDSFAKIVNSGELEKLKDINMGITLCVECHRKTDSYARRFSNG